MDTTKTLDSKYQFQLELHAAINRIQQSFISDVPFDDALEVLLDELLALTGSKFGFIGDIVHPEEGHPYLRIKVLTNIAWNKKTQALYDERKKSGLEFHRQDNLLGEVIRTGEPVVSNSPPDDHRAGGAPDGHPKLYAYLGLPYFHQGQLVGMIGLANRDRGYDDELIAHLKPVLDALEALNEARALKNQLLLSQRENAYLARVVKETTNCVLVADADFTIRWCNEAFERTSGFSLVEIVGHSPLAFLSTQKTPKATISEIRNAIEQRTDINYEGVHQHKHHDDFWVKVTCTPTFDEEGNHLGFISIATDISEAKAQEQRIVQLAYFDDLTGLANKHLFEQRVTHLMSLSRRYGYSIAAMFLQVCNMNDINETLGYGTGDLVIKAVSQRLSAAVRGADAISRYITAVQDCNMQDSVTVDREFDSLARLHCDNFALSAVITNPSGVSCLLDRLTKLMAEPFQIDGAEVYVTIKMGVAIFPHDADSYGALMRGANIALDQAMESSEQYCYFNADLGGKIQRNALMMKRLEDTLNHDSTALSLRFQPQINLKTNVLSGVEILLRWHDTELGQVSPAVFIPLAEERGLIDKITLWVVQAACQQIRRWQARGVRLHKDLGAKFAINLSARNLYSSEFLNTLIKTIHQHNLSSEEFEFELTETGLMQEPEKALSLLVFLRNSGFQLAIDDFGMGQSSLSYLKRVNADILKIDMYFVRNMLTEKANLAIVKTIISTAKIFGLKTLAEGVETAELALALKEMGCDCAQGYFYDAPLDNESFFAKWLTER